MIPVKFYHSETELFIGSNNIMVLPKMGEIVIIKKIKYEIKLVVHDYSGDTIRLYLTELD